MRARTATGADSVGPPTKTRLESVAGLRELNPGDVIPGEPDHLAVEVHH